MLATAPPFPVDFSFDCFLDFSNGEFKDGYAQEEDEEKDSLSVSSQDPVNDDINSNSFSDFFLTSELDVPVNKDDNYYSEIQFYERESNARRLASNARAFSFFFSFGVVLILNPGTVRPEWNRGVPGGIWPEFPERTGIKTGTKTTPFFPGFMNGTAHSGRNGTDLITLN